MGVRLSAGTNDGATIAGETIAGELYPYSKIIIGAVGVDGGPVSGTNGLPVAQQGTWSVNLGTIAGVALETSLSALNGKVTACNTGAVVVASGTITANLGTIAGAALETSLSALNGKVTACNTGAVVLASGTLTGITNAVAVTNADVASSKTALELLDNAVDGNCLNVNLNLAGTDCPTGQGSGSSALRVTLSNDLTDATYIGDIKFGESLPAGTNAIGKLAANSGIDIGDADVTSLACVRTAAAVGATLDTSALMNGATALTPKFALANVAASQTDANVVTAVGGKKIRVLAAFGVAGATATNLTFNSKGAGAGTAISALIANGANGGVVLPFNPLGWFETASGEALTVTTGAGSTTGIQVTYVEV